MPAFRNTAPPAVGVFLAFLRHLRFKLLAAPIGNVDDLGAVVSVGVKLFKQGQVMTAKTHGGFAGFVWWVAQQFQHASGAAQAGLEQFALHQLHAFVAQTVPVGHVPGAGHDVQVGKVFLGDIHNLERLLHIVNRDHQHPSGLRARNAQQVQTGGVAIKNPVAERSY